MTLQLDITDEIGDSAFDGGQFADASDLGDQGTTDSSGKFTPNWIPAFKSPIHGVILISGDSQVTVDLTWATIQTIFAVGSPLATIHEVLTLVGNVRPGAEKGHEQWVQTFQLSIYISHRYRV